MLVVFYTNQGPTRSENQDGLLVGGQIYLRTLSPQSLNQEQSGLLVVADGVGGYQGGEIASSTLLAFFSALKPVFENAERAILDLCYEVSDKLKDLSVNQENLTNMSTTMAGVLIEGSNGIVFNCGDCRVYRFSHPYLSKLTRDHSAVQLLFDENIINEDEMRKHPRKNVITSCIGIDKTEINIYFRRINLNSHFKLFLCSDGVWETLNLEKIEEIICYPIIEAANMLVNELFKEKAKDNISFILLEN
jgi:protein phosphatase